MTEVNPDLDPRQSHRPALNSKKVAKSLNAFSMENTSQNNILYILYTKMAA